MPPFIPRKRRASTTPQDLHHPTDSTTARKRARFTSVRDADRGSVPGSDGAGQVALDGKDDDEESSLSSIGSYEFEDVVSTGIAQDTAEKSHEEDHQDDNVDWEDAMAENASALKYRGPLESSNLEINLSRTGDETQDLEWARALANAKKGPTKIERQIRLQTHCMHVQFLLYHNAVRNCWACDKEVQNILVKQLQPGIVKEIEKWRAASGLQAMPADEPRAMTSKTKSKTRGKRMSVKEERSHRDWGIPSTGLEPGQPDLSRGDPIVPLLKVLTAYWRRKFSITAPGLRKRGYTTAAERQRLIRSFANGEQEVQKHGERIESLAEFRKLAVECKGSRDVGAQLFTALLRGIGIEARLVASLQPSGFGWTKSEQADTGMRGEAVDSKDVSSSSNESDEKTEVLSKHWNTDKRRGARQKTRGSKIPENRRSARKAREHDPQASGSRSDSDEASVIDVTPTMPRVKATKIDRVLPFPIYWTEVISPISSQVIPVSPLVLPNAVASTPEILSTFEPRGAKAEKAKQVIAYVVAYSQDGSAKDVTTRYLKKRMWPGKTKGFRIPVEKVPVYDKYGKVKRYEERDWFKSVMSGYVRTDKMRTAVDDVEEATDLVRQHQAKKETSHQVDTLQSLKSSADFVLERFLKREEAIRPGAKPVRTFVTGKGDNVKEENVFRRAEVDRCLSAESWHKEGRQVKEGEAPMKLVPIRAVTLARKREVEDMQRQTGEKPTQGLYSWDQTEYIIPPPIEDGVIPKNSYGNIDCFVPSMIPKGAVHVPMRGTVRMCKKLDIDYAEAVTGFEFGNKLAVPVIEGVVVAQEHETALRDAWAEYAEQQRIKEEGKLEQAVLSLWKRMLMGLRIRERVSDTYGEDINPRGEQTPEDGSLRSADDMQPPRDSVNDLDRSALSNIHDGGGFLLAPDEDGPSTASAELEVEHDARPRRRKPVSTGRGHPSSPPKKPSSKGNPVVISDSHSSDLSDPD